MNSFGHKLLTPLAWDTYSHAKICQQALNLVNKDTLFTSLSTKVFESVVSLKKKRGELYIDQINTFIHFVFDLCLKFHVFLKTRQTCLFRLVNKRPIFICPQSFSHVWGNLKVYHPFIFSKGPPHLTKGDVTGGRKFWNLKRDIEKVVTERSKRQMLSQTNRKIWKQVTDIFTTKSKKINIIT